MALKESSFKKEIDTKHALHGGNLIEEARRIGLNPKKFIDASASLVPFSPPKSLYLCLVKALNNNSLSCYPDCTHKSLREAIGEFHKIDPTMVIPGNGAAELLTWAAKEASRHGVSGLASPGFSDYERALNCWEADYIKEALPVSWSAKMPQNFPININSDVLWITNPHNPTGQLWSKTSLEKLLRKYQLVICDEAFLPLVPNGEKESLIPLISNNSNLIVIRSLTKLFNLAGLRIGYAIGCPSKIKRWREWRDPWPLNGLAIAAGTSLLNDQYNLTRWIRMIHKWIKIEGLWLYSKLNSLPNIYPQPSSTNFLLIKSYSSLIPLREKLIKNHILLRDCRSFEGLGECYLRVSLQTRPDNSRILNAIKKSLV